jgi:hypothetical protein
MKPALACSLLLLLLCSACQQDNPSEDGGDDGGNGPGNPGEGSPVSGWTQFTQTTDDEVIYVSNSGNDANPGTEAQPLQTLAAGFAALRDYEADWLLLRRGDTFNVTGPFMWDKSGPASGGWMRLGAWGSEEDPRPILETADTAGIVITPGFQSTRNTHRIAITDIHLRAGDRMASPATQTTTPTAIQTVASSWAGTGFAFSDILFENLLIEGFAQGYVGGSDLQNLSIRRCIFHYIFTPDGTGGAQGVIASPSGWLLEENIFYRIQSPDIPGVSADAYSTFMHSAYIVAQSSNVTTRGNFVLRATECLMQRPGGLYSRNVGAHCRVAGLIGQAWGVTPTAGGVTTAMEESLLLNTTEQAFFIGNTAQGTVRENMLVRDQDGTIDFDIQLVPQGGGNMGVHNTAFTDNRISGDIDWNAGDTASFSGLSFTGNQQGQGMTNTSIADYLASINWSGDDLDDWAQRLITRDRLTFTAEYQTLSVINFYRVQLGLTPLN